MADPRTVAPATSILLTLGLICFAEPGFAQQPDSSASAAALKKLSIEQLMNLEVTSVSRRPERLAQVASAIQVITQQDIRRSGASSLPEALRLATNLQVAQVNSRDWAISARGFNSTTANKLLVLIDGRTVYTPLYSGVFWDVQDVPLGDVDRIEVISGPGATLWGANAVNGVINVITKRARETQGLRSEEHTSELQSQSNLVCRLLLEKKKDKDGSVVRPPRGAMPDAQNAVSPLPD